MDCFVASLLAMTGAGGDSLNANAPPHAQPSSPAKAGEPVFQGVGDGADGYRARDFMQGLGRFAPRGRERVFSVIASEAKQSISPRKGRMDCFVASLLAMTGAGGNSLNANSPPHTQPSSPANAGDPVFRGVSDGAEKPRRTGYSAKYDGLYEAHRAISHLPRIAERQRRHAPRVLARDKCSDDRLGAYRKFTCSGSAARRQLLPTSDGLRPACN